MLRMRAYSRQLVRVGLTKPSWMSIVDQGAWQFRKLCRRIARRYVVVWMDNWLRRLFPMVYLAGAGHIFGPTQKSKCTPNLGVPFWGCSLASL